MRSIIINIVPFLFGALVGIVFGTGVTRNGSLANFRYRILELDPVTRNLALAGLIPLGMFIAGADALVVLGLPQHVTSPSIVWQRLVCGLLVGCGAGYFVLLFRVESKAWLRCRREKKIGESGPRE